MRAGLQRHVGCGAARCFAGGVEGRDLRVRSAFAGVHAFAYDGAAFDDDAADVGIRADFAHHRLGDGQGAEHVV
jgi:hypothetical protein